MKITNYLVISFGNFETKILLTNVDESENVRVIYKSLFKSKEMISNSIITDKDKLKDVLVQQIDKIKNIFGFIPENIIINLPIKDFIIEPLNSPEYPVNKFLNKKQWKKIYDSIEYTKPLKGYYIIDKKVHTWFLDGIEYTKPPINIDGKIFSFRTQFYLSDEKYVKPYIDLLKKINIKPTKIIHDPLVMPITFNSNLRQNKLLVNIGHNNTEIILYKNNALINRKNISFAIRDLTSTISKKLSCSEDESINILKKYANIISINDKNIPFLIIEDDDYGKYKSLNMETINNMFSNWLIDLISNINSFYEEVTLKRMEIDELYISSSINFFEQWINFIKAKLLVKVDIFNINDVIIGINEPKFLPLYYSVKYTLGD